MIALTTELDYPNNHVALSMHTSAQANKVACTPDNPLQIIVDIIITQVKTAYIFDSIPFSNYKLYIGYLKLW